MKKMTVKEFINKSNIEIIQELIKMNKGYITTKQLSDFGIHRMYLNIMEKKKLIERVGCGIYIDYKKIEDSYYVFSQRMPNAIFSHFTALYFHGLSIKAPNDKYDITVKKTYNSNHLKDHEVFYVSGDIYNLGLSKIKTPMGNEVKAYDIERCICDIIRSKKRMDIEHVKYSIKEYLKRKDKDLVKLSEYAKKMGIEKDVIEFVSMFYD
jgi:predicted transcriptional regulator of viral defense system